MAVGFGYSTDTPEGCWDDLADRDRARPARPTVDSPEDIAALAVDLDREPVRGRRGGDGPLGPARARLTTRPIAELLGAIDEQISLGVESGLAVGLYPTIVELLKTIETHLAEGYRRVKIKIQPGQRRRARPRGPPALRRHPADGRRQRRLHRRRHRRLPRAR